MGFGDMEKLCHRMENQLDRVRNGQLSFDSGLATLLFQALDTLARDMVRTVTGTEYFQGQDPVRVLLAWTFEPETWRTPSQVLAEELGPAFAGRIHQPHS